MNRTDDDGAEPIVLGVASEETQGPMGTRVEPSSIGKLAGISDE